MRLIQSPAELDGLVARLSREPLLAVDTEAASFHRYHDRVYLLQISSRDETAIVDPLAVGTLAPLAEPLADPAIEIVFHDADYDLRLLDREYGFGATNLFDTRVAAQLLNEPGVGLAALLEKYFSLKLDKRFQRADWSARPLSPPMLEYAAADTRHLPKLRDILRDRLEERGRLDWAAEEFALLSRVRGTQTDAAEPGWLRMKGAKALRGRELAVLRELWEWREATARRADRATFRILNNEPMFAMAKQPPADLAALRAIGGVSADQAERRGREILAAVNRALEIPEAELPRLERPLRRRPDPAFEARMERLKAARNRLAAKYDLAPGVLCPNGTLEAIAHVKPESVEELAAIREIRRWQVKEIGGELLEAVKEAAAGTPAVIEAAERSAGSD
ncbi:MAG: ribonuclease D [Gemmatimonadales bacterium]|nr:ribonuclease D [Gemmatimonadales bacterium]MBA3555189.1 ribonuclease D [Gemmatimonadales bacterium]